jgi:hypothetical protein
LDHRGKYMPPLRVHRRLSGQMQRRGECFGLRTAAEAQNNNAFYTHRRSATSWTVGSVMTPPVWIPTLSRSQHCTGTFAPGDRASSTLVSIVPGVLFHRKADVQPIMLNGGAPTSPHGVHPTRHADKSPARPTKQGGCAGAWKARCGWQVTPADYDNPMTGMGCRLVPPWSLITLCCFQCRL